MSDKVLKLLEEKMVLDENDFLKRRKNPFQRFWEKVKTWFLSGK